MCVCLQAVCKESSSPGLLGHNKQERSCWSVSNTAAAASAGAFINSGNKYFKRKQAKGQDVVSGLIWQFLHDVPLKWYFTKRVMDTRSNVVCLTFTHPHTFRIVFEPFQAREDSFPVLLPLSFAENYFQEVPGPANQRDLQQLVLGQHFWTLERGRRTFLIRKLNIFHERDDAPHNIHYHADNRLIIRCRYHFILHSITHPKNTKSFTDGPATQEVDLKIVVEDDDHMLLAKHVCRGLVSV